jgi:hypothetical protein
MLTVITLLMAVGYLFPIPSTPNIVGGAIAVAIAVLGTRYTGVTVPATVIGRSRAVVVIAYMTKYRRSL